MIFSGSPTDLDATRRVTQDSLIPSPSATLTEEWTDVLPWPAGGIRPGMAYDVESRRIVAHYPNLYWSWEEGLWAFDPVNETWSRLFPTVRPNLLSYHSFVYDAESDRIILYGRGINVFSAGQTWAYDFNSNTWTDMNPTSRPPVNADHAMAYDAESDRVVLFGGYYPHRFYDVTWAYDFNSNTWTNMSPSVRPAARRDHAMAYDAESDRVVLFGGSWSNETWTYDYNSNTWTRMDSPSNPGHLSSHDMAYDPVSDRVILFGGETSDFTPTNETWSYDHNMNRWVKLNLAVAPPAQYGMALAHDLATGKIFAYGGSDYHLWSLVPATGVWHNVRPFSRPPPQSGVALAYDSQSDRVVMFGPAGTWAYDFNSNAWMDMQPAVSPPLRSLHAMAYDSKSDRVILFGGYAVIDGTVFGDTWGYDYDTNSWSNVSPAVSPSPRLMHAMGYDSESDRMILFGGEGPTYASLQDTWAYDFDQNRWFEEVPSSALAARYAHAMSYDSEADRIILFGGSALGRLTNETWAYDANTRTWEARQPRSSPPARYEFAMAYDVHSRRTVLFSGQVESPTANDTWSYDYETNAWFQRGVTVAPPWRFWHAMAYDSESDRIVLFGNDLSAATWAHWHPPTPPRAPRNLTATPAPGAIKLSWEAPSFDGTVPILGYRIYRGTTSDGLSFLVDVGDILRYVDDTPTVGIPYFYQVGAFNAEGEGPASNRVTSEASRPNSVPVASFTVFPESGSVWTVFEVDAASSVDMEDPDSALMARWDWEDDGVWDTTWSHLLNASHRFADPGTYSVRLEILDSGGLSSQAVGTITVVGPLRITLRASPRLGSAPLVVEFSSAVSGGRPAFAYGWHFGDGTSEGGGTGAGPTASHTYTRPGNYTATLMVTDADGVQATSTALVEVLSSEDDAGGAQAFPVQWGIVSLVGAGAGTVAVLLAMRRRHRKRRDQ